MNIMNLNVLYFLKRFHIRYVKKNTFKWPINTRRLERKFYGFVSVESI